MFEGSSRGRSKVNWDGSTEVYCFQCGEFIANTFQRVTSSMCEMCRRVQNGEVITEQALKEYQMQKMGKSNVSMLNLQDNIPEPAKKFTLRSMTGEFVRAFKSVIKAPQTEKTNPSIAVANSKRRGRLFDKIDFGSIENVDEKLKEKQ